MYDFSQCCGSVLMILLLFSLKVDDTCGKLNCMNAKKQNYSISKRHLIKNTLNYNENYICLACQLSCWCCCCCFLSSAKNVTGTSENHSIERIKMQKTDSTELIFRVYKMWDATNLRFYPNSYELRMRPCRLVCGVCLHNPIPGH